MGIIFYSVAYGTFLLQPLDVVSTKPSVSKAMLSLLRNLQDAMNTNLPIFHKSNLNLVQFFLIIRFSFSSSVFTKIMWLMVYVKTPIANVFIALHKYLPERYILRRTYFWPVYIFFF